MITYHIIESKLRELGLREGMYIEVHSSLSSFGQIDGGAETVILILQNIITLHFKDGYGLLLGVDIYRLSSMHYVESILPNEIRDIFKPSDEVQSHYPKDKWYIETGNPPEKAWYKIQDQAYKNGYIKDITIGNAKCMFFKVNHVINLYKKALERDPFELYGMKKKSATM